MRNRSFLLFFLLEVLAFPHATSFTVKNRLGFATRGRCRRLDSVSFTQIQEKAFSLDPRSRLRHYQETAAPIATSFVPSEYNPHPLLTNCHLQTIGGVFLRQECSYATVNTIPSMIKRALLLQPLKSNDDDDEWFWDERQCIHTPDGDFFHVDFKYYSPNTEKGTVVLLHGLQSNSNSSLSVDMARAYHDSGMTVACINFRGCSGVPNDTLGGYHFGFTDDFKLFLNVLKESGRSSRQKPVYVSGFSLGGNVALKALGELGVHAVELYHVHGAAVAGVPFDNERNYPSVNAPGFNRVVYTGNFLKSLKERTQQQLSQFCNGNVDTTYFDYPRSMTARTSYEWEDAFIAPVYGFDDFIDYYRQTSCTYFLQGIAVPTLIINAADDPFFDPDVFPVETSVQGGGFSPLNMVQTKHGGHLGFLFHQVQEDHDEQRVSSWMPTELARYISHVNDHPESPIPPYQEKLL